MGLLVAYVICLLIGQTVTIMVGLSIDRIYSPHVSLPISIALYFAVFWIAWKIAVRLTAPRTELKSAPVSESTVLPPPQAR